MVKVWALVVGMLVSSLAWAESFDPSSAYRAVLDAVVHERHHAVVGLAEAFLATHPQLDHAPQVQLWLSMSLGHLRRRAEALKALDRLKHQIDRDDPLWPDVLFWEGELSRKIAQRLRAKLVWTQLLEQFPESAWVPKTHMGLGLVYLSQDAAATALEHFRRVEVLSPHSPLARTARRLHGVCLLRLERFDEALPVFQALLVRPAMAEETEQVAFYLGEALSGLGRYEEAVQAYQRCLGVYPDSTWDNLAWFGLGWAHFQRGRCDESLEAFSRYQPGVSANHDAQALFAHASCLVRLGEDERAATLLNRLEDAAPSHPLARESGLLLADIDHRHGRLDLAATRLERLLVEAHESLDSASSFDSLSLAQDSPERSRGTPPSGGVLSLSKDEAPWRFRVSLDLGMVRLAQGDVERAERHLTVARQTSDSAVFLAALSGLGDVRMFVGDLEGAERWYHNVQVLSQEDGLERTDQAMTPAEAYATYQVGRIQLLRGQPEAAATTFDRTRRLARPPLADDASLALALAYIRQREEAKASAVLETIRRTQPGAPPASRAAYYLALLALAEGRGDEARRFCEEAIAGAPHSGEGVEAALLLAELEAAHGQLAQAADSLRAQFGQPGLPIHLRGKLAKRLGEFAQRSGDYAQAIQWYERTAQVAPALRGEMAYRLASCYEEGGDIEVAIAHYRAIHDPAWHVRGQSAAAKLFERQGQPKAAFAIYESLARRRTTESKIAREHLAMLGGATEAGE